MHKVKKNFLALYVGRLGKGLRFNPKPNSQCDQGMEVVKGFKLKRKADGTISRHSGQLVAKGFHQQASIDYDEIFSLVVKPTTTIQTVLSMAYSASWLLKQINIQNASLHDFLSKEVYMFYTSLLVSASPQVK